jgi:hypothetical protein
MMRKIVGYFEGTDSTLLTALVCDGIDTVPVSNGYDNHGSDVRLINDQNRYDLLIGYLHKVYAPETHVETHFRFQDVVHSCRTYSIPLVLEVPSALKERARELMDDPPEVVQFVDPSDMLDVVRKILTGADE